MIMLSVFSHTENLVKKKKKKWTSSYLEAGCDSCPFFELWEAEDIVRPDGP